MGDKEVKVLLTGDNSSLLGVLAGAGKATEAMAHQMEGALSGVAGLLEKFAAPLTAFLGVLGGGAIFKEAVTETAQFGDTLAKTSQKVGVSVESLSGLAHAAKLSGLEFDSLTGGLGKLAKNMQAAVFTPNSPAAAAFKALGIQVEDASGHLRSTDDVMGDVAEKFHGMNDSAGKTALAMNLFGKSGKDMIPLLNEGREGIAELKAEAQRLGVVMTTEQAKAAEKYKDDMERVEAALKGLKIRIGEEVMPALTRLAEWFTQQAPAMLSGITSAMQGLGAILSNGVVQWLAFTTAITMALEGMIIPLVMKATAAFQTMMLQMALARMEGMSALASFASMVNPVFLITAAVVGLALAYDHLATSDNRAAEAANQAADATSRGTEKYNQLSQDLLRVDSVLESTTAGTKEHTAAEEKKAIILAQLNALYPGFNQFLVDENGHTRSVAEAIALATAKRKEDIAAKIKDAEAELYLAQVKLRHVEADKGLLSVEGPLAMIQGWFHGGQGKLETKAVKDRTEALDKLRESLKALGTTSESKGEAPNLEKPGKDSELARLQAELEQKKFAYEQDALAHGQYLQYTKAQEAAFWAENLNDAALSDKDKEKVNKLYFEAKRAVMLEDHKAELADMESRMNEFKNDAAQRLAIAQRLEDKAGSPAEKQKARELQAKIRAEMQQDEEKAAQLQITTQAKHQEAQLALDSNFFTRMHDLGVMSDQGYLTMLVQAENQKYQIALKGLRDRLQLLAFEGDKRKEEVAKINGEIQALEDKHNANLQGLQFKQADLNQQKSAWAGWSAGIRDALNAAGTQFQIFRNAANQVMSGVTNAFSTGLQGLLSGQMSFGQTMKSIWSGIVQSVIQSIAQLIAQWVVMTVVKKALGIDEAETDGARTSAALTTAAAETWAAYAGIPFVGPALAEAQIALMDASMVTAMASSAAIGNKVAVGAAEGAWFDKPTLAVIGEGKRPELVVPDVAFKDFAANLSANILAQERQAQDYSRQASTYASASTQPQAGSPQYPAGDRTVQLHLSLAGANVFDTSQRGLRNFGRFVFDGARVAAREAGVVLQPGQVFGGL